MKKTSTLLLVPVRRIPFAFPEGEPVVPVEERALREADSERRPDFREDIKIGVDFETWQSEEPGIEEDV